MEDLPSAPPSPQVIQGESTISLLPSTQHPIPPQYSNISPLVRSAENLSSSLDIWTHSDHYWYSLLYFS